MGNNTILKKSDYDKICRTCLKYNDEMMSVYDTEVLNMLTICTSIKIRSDDGLPTQLCSSCYSKTCEFYDFKQSCEDSDKILHQMLEYENEAIDPSITESTENIKPDIKLEQTLSNEAKSDLEDNNLDSLSENDDEDCDDFAFDPTEANTESNKDTAREKALSWGYKCDPETNTCKICNKVLVNIHSLVRHMEMHNENRKFHVTCKVCGKGFYETGHLTKHMLRHKGEAKYSCEKCPKTFYELSALGVHMLRKHKARRVKCGECGKQFMVELQLKIHMKTHGEGNKFTCKECGKTFHQANILRKHLIKHTKERLFHCIQCDKSFKDKYALNTHLKYSHSGEKKKEICNICGKSVIHLQSHLLVHSEERVKCLICCKEFSSKYCLNSHMKKKHGDPNEPRPKPYLCSSCGYTSESKAALKIHNQHKHTTERAHKCPVCGKSFKTAKVVTYHIRYTHENERKYNCSICPKSFQTSTTLKIHMRTHTGERPFSCNLCGKSFGQGSTLKTHMKVHGFQAADTSNDDVCVGSQPNYIL